MTRLFWIIAFLALVSAPRLEAQVFTPETFTLDNGMQVVLIKNNRVPIVRHMVWYKVGSADEPSGKSGIAHYFEHLMFKGTEKLAPGEFSKIVAINGGRDNAFTSYDFTAYFQSVAKDRLGLMMSLEAERMRNLTLTAEIIEPERQVVLEERRQRTDNDPAAQLFEQMSATLFMNHPYRIPVIGWAHEIDTLSLEDLKTFYQKWYAPNNAILIVEGDMTLDELRPLAQKHYGSLPPSDFDITRNRASEPRAHANRIVIKRDARVAQPVLRKLFLAPSYGQPGDDPMAPYALQVLEQIMSNSATGRLHRSLVVDQKIAVSAGMYHSATRLGPAELGLWVVPKDGVSLEDAEQALMAEIDLLIDKGITQDELNRARKTMINEAIFARDRLGTAAYVLGSALSTGQTIDKVESWPETLRRLTVQDVNQALKAVLEDRYSVTGHLLGLKEAS